MAQLSTGSNLVPSARMEGDALVASIASDVDLNNSPDLRMTLLDLVARNAPKCLVLNLTGVTYMDSSAIAVLVELLRKMKQGNVLLANLQPRVKGLLEIARLNSIFVIAADENDALARVGAA